METIAQRTKMKPKEEDAISCNRIMEGGNDILVLRGYLNPRDWDSQRNKGTF